MRQFDPASLYFKEIRSIPDLTKEDVKALWKRSRKGDTKAQKRLVEANLRLVIPITRRYMGRSLEFLDLVEEGNLGLMRAVEKFKPHKKISFSTYATYWIDQSMRRAIEDKSKTIRIPAHMWDNIHAYLRERDKLKKSLGYEPTIKELAKCLKLSVKQVLAVQSATGVARVASSLDAPVDAGGEMLMKDVIPDKHGHAPDSITEMIRHNDGVQEALNHLDPRAKMIIEYRFGLAGKQPESLGIIADKLKISRERVRQIEANSMRRLKSLFAKVGILEREHIEQMHLDARATKKDRRKAKDRRQGLPDMRRRKLERRKGNRRSGKDRRKR